MTSSACRVLLADGTRLGEIVDVADYGAGDLIDVKVEGRKDTVLIPFADQYVLEADGEQGSWWTCRRASSTWRTRREP